MNKNADIPDIENFEGYVLNLKIWQSRVLKNTLIFSIPTTFACFKDDQEQIFLSAVTLKGEAFFFPLSKESWFTPFVSSSFGPALFSRKEFAGLKIGGHIGFQSTLGIGTYLIKKISIECYILHYCNAGIKKPNVGATIPIVGGGLSY